MKTYILPDKSAFGVMTINSPYNSFVKRWKHKLFHCPTFWKMFLGIRKKYRCPICNRQYLCYWDANDIEGHGTGICNICARNINDN